MYTGRMIEDLITTVERAECWAAAEPAEILREHDLNVHLACLLERSYGDVLVEVA
jgi:hypothetical protein